MSILSISSMSLPVVILEFPEPHAVQKHNMHWVFEAPLCNLKLEFSHQCSIFKYTQCTLIVFIILAKKRSLNVFHLFLKIIIFFLLLLLLDDVLFTVFPTFITVFLSVFHLYKGYLRQCDSLKPQQHCLLCLALNCPTLPTPSPPPVEVT